MPRRLSVPRDFAALVALAAAISLFAPTAMGLAHGAATGCPQGCPMAPGQPMPRTCCRTAAGQVPALAGHDLEAPTPAPATAAAAQPAARRPAAASGGDPAPWVQPRAPSPPPPLRI